MQIPRNDFFIPPGINLNDRLDQPKLPERPNLLTWSDDGPCSFKRGGIAGRLDILQPPHEPLRSWLLPK